MIELIEKCNLTNQKKGRIKAEAMVPGKNGKKPIPKPLQKKIENFLIFIV